MTASQPSRAERDEDIVNCWQIWLIRAGRTNERTIRKNAHGLMSQDVDEKSLRWQEVAETKCRKEIAEMQCQTGLRDDWSTKETTSDGLIVLRNHYNDSCFNLNLTERGISPGWAAPEPQWEQKIPRGGVLKWFRFSRMQQEKKRGSVFWFPSCKRRADRDRN